MKVVYNLGALTAGALLATAAAGAAHAQPDMVSTDNVGVLNGTQAVVPIQAPINVCGNAIAVIGNAGAGCQGGSAATLDAEWTFRHFQMVSSDNVGIGNGTQVFAPIQLPIDVCGNAVSVIGSAFAGCEGGADADMESERDQRRPGHKPGGHGYYQPAEQAPAAAAATSPAAAPVTSQAVAPVAETVAGTQAPPYAELIAPAGGPTMISSGNVGVLNGTQVLAPIQIPINICGVAIPIIGSAGAGCEGGAQADLDW